MDSIATTVSPYRRLVAAAGAGSDRKHPGKAILAGEIVKNGLTKSVLLQL